jgi:hypothetical protein
VISRNILETTPEKNVIDVKSLESYHNATEPEEHTIGLPHCLLKPTEAISIRVLLVGPKGNITQSGKIPDGTVQEIIPTTRENEIRIGPAVTEMGRSLLITFVELLAVIVAVIGK